MNAPDSENARLPIQLPGILFLYVFSFFCGGSQVSAKVAGQIAVFDPAAVSSQPKWLKLLHYKNSASTPESDVLNSGFFLTPQGRIDPRAEARALFQQIILKTTEPPGDESAICRFPARSRWLANQLNLPLPPSNCSQLERFKNSIAAAGVSVVFSSYYLNNPSSSFGHTFLRFKRSEGGETSERAELLDSGVNYAANVTSTNAILYALYGAIGGFRGTFSKMPYYYKVREYSDFESRDLWSYDLNLSPAEIEELVNHIWELGSAEFDYYFFSRNCSYQILAALDVLRPEWNFTEAMGTIVFPSETIKLLAARPGLIKAVEYRPSKRKIFEEHIPALSVGERRLFDRILASRKPEFPEDIPVEVRRKVLDALIDYHDFRYGKEILTGNGPRSEERQGFLVARSVLGLKSTELPIRPPLEKQPQLGHDPHRLSFTAGHSTFQGDFLGLNLRGGFHDLLDPPDGYPDHSQIELLDAGVRIVSASAKIRLDHLLLVNNASLTPLRPYSSPLSWRLRIGMERLSESGCPDCLAGRFQLGGGVTVEAIQDHLYFYFLPQIGADWAPGFEGTKLRPGLGVLGGTRIQIYRNLAGTLDGTAFRGILSARTELRLAPSSDSAIGLTGSASAFNTEAGASLYLYF